jgi:CheY-like chemotaxis protein
MSCCWQSDCGSLRRRPSAKVFFATFVFPQRPLRLKAFQDLNRKERQANPNDAKETSRYNKSAMSRILLVHWNEKEARERSRKLEALGHKTAILSDTEKRNFESVRESPHDLFLIGLTRLPSHGREIAGYLRRLKATRHVPILFVDGDADRVSRTRSLLPDADFAKWEELKTAIPKAKKRVPAKPVVPGTMAGYSGTPLFKKLGIRENSAVVLINPPDRFERKLEPLPAGAEIVDNPKLANVAVLFALSQSELIRDFRPLAKALPEKTALWIAWPKKASGVATDLTEDVVREFGLAAGWVDYKICAIDETWSGLCFARRKN